MKNQEETIANIKELIDSGVTVIIGITQKRPFSKDEYDAHAVICWGYFEMDDDRYSKSKGTGAGAYTGLLVTPNTTKNDNLMYVNTKLGNNIQVADNQTNDKDYLCLWLEDSDDQYINGYMYYSGVIKK